MEIVKKNLEHSRFASGMKKTRRSSASEREAQQWPISEKAAFMTLECRPGRL
jgi:hypothetical protein